MKVKIIYFITKSVWGGAAKYTLDLASGLPAEQFQAFIAASGEGPLKDRAVKKGIAWIPIPHFARSISFFSDIASFVEVFGILRRERPDIIHVNSSKAGGICGLAGFFYNLRRVRKVKMIFTVHGWPVAESRPLFQRRLIIFASRLTSFFYDRVIVITSFDFELTRKLRLASTAKIVLIYNGINPGEVAFLSKEEARKKMGLPPEVFVIGTIGEWNRNKGWDILVEAFSSLDGSPTLLLIGSGENPEADLLLDLIRVRGLGDKVKAIEFIENAASYLHAFDIFAFPSRKEGLPYALLEAGLAECLVIASAVGGNIDIVQNDRTGILIPPEDPEALAKGIIRLMENPEEARQFGVKLKEKVEREFTIYKMREKTYALYSALL